MRTANKKQKREFFREVSLTIGSETLAPSTSRYNRVDSARSGTAIAMWFKRPMESFAIDLKNVSARAFAMWASEGAVIGLASVVKNRRPRRAAAFMGLCFFLFFRFRFKSKQCGRQQ
jgi:hypothetical protein